MGEFRIEWRNKEWQTTREFNPTLVLAKSNPDFYQNVPPSLLTETLQVNLCQ
jgi:hypothetical protein